MIRMIVAVDQGNAIGWADGRLPWKLPADMRRFKELTTGHTVVMGFNTFRSLNRPDGLPNRKNIVLTRKSISERRGCSIGNDVAIISSLDWVKHQKEVNLSRAITDWQDEVPTIWIIGGARVYDEALAKKLVDEIHLTLVHTASEADVRVSTDLAAWKRFILTERKRGVNWEVVEGHRQRDGDHETSYLILRRST